MIRLKRRFAYELGRVKSLSEEIISKLLDKHWVSAPSKSLATDELPIGATRQYFKKNLDFVGNLMYTPWTSQVGLQLE